MSTSLTVLTPCKKNLVSLFSKKQIEHLQIAAQNRMLEGQETIIIHGTKDVGCLILI